MWIILTLADGSTLWLAPGAIYAIEKSPNEKTTVVKTAMEPFVVVESPQEVFDRIEEASQPKYSLGDEEDPLAWTEKYLNQGGASGGSRGLEGD